MVLCLTALFAQAPEKLTYQAVVRNAGNALVTNTQVGVRVSVLQGSASGSAVYVETQTATTNANGLMTVEIGGGNAQQGVFADIDWANGPYFLKTETDPSGGSNYSVTSTQQLLSVPYALYAKEAGNSFSGDYNDLTNAPAVPTSLSQLTNDAGFVTATGCEGVSLCELHDSLTALRDTITLLQATVEALTNPYTESTPMVTTTVVSYITQTSAYCGGIVTSMRRPRDRTRHLLGY